MWSRAFCCKVCQSVVQGFKIGINFAETTADNLQLIVGIVEEKYASVDQSAKHPCGQTNHLFNPHRIGIRLKLMYEFLKPFGGKDCILCQCFKSSSDDKQLPFDIGYILQGISDLFLFFLRNTLNFKIYPVDTSFKIRNSWIHNGMDKLLDDVVQGLSGFDHCMNKGGAVR